MGKKNHLGDAITSWKEENLGEVRDKENSMCIDIPFTKQGPKLYMRASLHNDSWYHGSAANSAAHDGGMMSLSITSLPFY